MCSLSALEHPRQGATCTCIVEVTLWRWSETPISLSHYTPAIYEISYEYTNNQAPFEIVLCEQIVRK
jgi:hypothetical protein